MVDILQKIKESKKNLFVGLAGPGAGKTHTFKTIIESDEYKNKNILVLSFINKLVDDLLGDFKNFKNVHVSTLHSFAKKELEKTIKKINKEEDVFVDLDPDLDEIISEDLRFLKGKDFNYKEKFYNNNLTEGEEKFYKTRKDFYKYGKELYSFNSVIYSINKLFEKCADIIPVYDLILVDEFQDFNKLECELIKLLNKRSKVLIVGDDNQSLYAFKIAEPQQIRDLYKAADSEPFSLDNCYRCTEVVVSAANELIENAQKSGYLRDSHPKIFLYPSREDKNKISAKYPQIDFMPAISGDLLAQRLAKNIKKQIENDKGKRVLILVPSYLKQTIYDGLLGNGLHVVDFELFSEEKCSKKNHKDLIETFETLLKRKTDNLSLRKILFLYFDINEIKIILQDNKKIWTHLKDDDKKKIEKDVEIFQKVKTGREKLNEEELNRFDKIFTIKNVLSKLMRGFKLIRKGSLEVEMTTVTSSKGLNVDFVYYIGIDDRNMLKRGTEIFSDQKICEFLVGITRPKEKLTLISLYDENPKILEFLNKKHINKI